MTMSRIILVIAAVLMGSGAFAQDIHFSQFFNAPLMLNPALTGKVNGTFRVGVNYRNQWFGALNGRTSFSTPALSFDAPIVLNNGDAVGVGAYIVNDQSSGGLYSRLQFFVTGAYHKALGKDNKHALSIGLQAGYIQRRLDINKILFQSQIGSDFNADPAAVASGENIDGTTSNVDINTGIMWGSKISQKFFFYTGVGLFNIIQPFNTFTQNADDLMRRVNASAGIDARLSKRFSLLPSFIYQWQAKAQETNVGLSGAIDVSDAFVLYAGAYYRVKDAVIPYLGADFKGVRLGVSYDVNASSLGQIDGGSNGSVELSFMYIGKAKPLPTVNPAMYCPRF